MIYVSKGSYECGNNDRGSCVCRAGKMISLDDDELRVWKNGRLGFCEVFAPAEKTTVARLVRLGLADREVRGDPTSRYRLATRSTFCITNEIADADELSAVEKDIYKWLRFAGVHLTTAELVYLTENGIETKDELLFEVNRQALIERIYTADTIPDGKLERLMERAVRRDDVVTALASLMRHNCIFVL